MKSYNEFCQTAYSESEYKFLVSTCRTTEAVHLCKKDGADVYNKRVSKIETISATSLKEASKKFEKTDSYILFSAKNKELMTFKFYISPDRILHRFIENSDEIIEVYNYYGASLLDYLFKHYELSLEDNTSPSSIFYDYFLQERDSIILPPDVKRLEKLIIDNSTEETQAEYNLLTKTSCNTPELQYKMAELLCSAAYEEREKNRPLNTGKPWQFGDPVSKTYDAPALYWALKAAESHYPPAYYKVSKLIDDRQLKLALVIHAAFLGVTEAQVDLAVDHANDIKPAELPYLVEYNPEYARFWFNILIKKDDPSTYEKIALFFYQGLNKDFPTANTYYRKLINLGETKYYEDFILFSIFEDDISSASDALDELMKTDNAPVLKNVFHELERHDHFGKLNNRNIKYELANRILQLSNDILYLAYISEHHYSNDDISACKRCIHTILGSSNVEAVSNAYNVFKKNLFLRLNDISLELEFITEAGKLGNPKASLALQKGYKKGLFGSWKHTRDWSRYNL